MSPVKTLFRRESAKLRIFDKNLILKDEGAVFECFTLKNKICKYIYIEFYEQPK